MRLTILVIGVMMFCLQNSYGQVNLKINSKNELADQTLLSQVLNCDVHKRDIIVVKMFLNGYFPEFLENLSRVDGRLIDNNVEKTAFTL